MHTLSLYAQIPFARYEQALSILTGLSAMQGRHIHNLHCVLQPTSPPADPNLISKKQKPGASALNAASAQQLSYLQLITNLTSSGDAATSEEQHTCTVKSLDTPEPETKTLTLRRVAVDETIPAGEAAARYADGDKFKIITHYTTQGHRFIHNNTVLDLYRVLCFKPDHQPPPLASSPASVPDDATVPLDSSGAFILEASIGIEDRGKPRLVQAATDQLLALRTELRGALELRVPERLALDTRVRA